MSDSPKFKNIDQLLSLLKGVKPDGPEKWFALCPAHDDHQPSLHIRLLGDRAQLKCFSGCDTTAVVKALGLTMASLHLGPGDRAVGAREIERVYQYLDARRRLIFEVVRFRPKAFAQRRPDPSAPGGFQWGLKGITPMIYRLPEVLQAVAAGEPILIVEGEKDADNGAALGFNTTTCPMGAGKWRDDYTSSLQGAAEVVILADNDPPGRDGKRTGHEHAVQVATSLHRAGIPVKVIEMPDPAIKDLSDWIDAGLTRESLLGAIEAAPAWAHNGSGKGGLEHTRPVIIITARYLPDKTAEAYTALINDNNPPRIFRHGGGLARVEPNEMGQPVITPLNESAVRGELARVAAWETIGREGDSSPTAPPLEVVRDLMTMPGGWPDIPVIKGVTENPVIREDGSILAAEGYDSRTCLYYYPDKGLHMPPIPEAPTPEDIEGAQSLLEELFADFPFDSVVSRTNILAALLTPIIRPLITGPTPLCVIDKPQVGSGASLIATVIARVTTGRPPAMMTAPRDPEEWRKTVTSVLMEGRGVVVLDNLEGALYDANLAAVLTATTYAARLLTKNQIIDLPNLASWMATGNNISLGGDLPRRAYLVRIDPGMARPWLRDPARFQHPELEAWAALNRGRILAAILTLARAWIMVGRPPPADLPRLGGYESWVRVAGGILANAGIKGFLANLMELYERNDSETPAWTAFVTTWYAKLGDRKVTGKELQDAIQAYSELEEALPDRVGPPRRDAAGTIIDKGFTRRLGRQLAARKGRIYPGDENGDYMLDLVGSSDRALKWQVRKGKEDEFHPLKLPGFEAKNEFDEFHTISEPLPKQSPQNIKSNINTGTNSSNSFPVPDSCVEQNSSETPPPGEDFDFTDKEDL